MPGINREIGGPTIVGGPGQVAALKQQIAGSVITHDEDDVALCSRIFSCQFPQIYAAQPIVGNGKFNRGFPVTFVNVILANWWYLLRGAFERVKTFHQSSPISVVVTGPKDLQIELGLRIGAHHNLQGLTRTHAIG